MCMWILPEDGIYHDLYAYYNSYNIFTEIVSANYM